MVAFDARANEILLAVRVLGRIFAFGALLDSLDSGDQRVLQALFCQGENFLAGLAAAGLETRSSASVILSVRFWMAEASMSSSASAEELTSRWAVAQKCSAQVQFGCDFLADGPLGALGGLRRG